MVRRAVIFTLIGVALMTAESSAVVKTITLSGFTFTPSAVTIAEGDTVRWNLVSGSHTTTSGLGFADPAAGVLWDEPINIVSPSFERQFNTAGVIPFFCRPHEAFGMKGTITVTSANNVPIARDTALSTVEEAIVNGRLHGFDADGDPLQFTVESGPFHGSLTGFNNLTGEFTYDPDLDFDDLDSIVFSVSDGAALSGPGVARITVTGINDPPVASNLPIGLVKNTTQPVGAMPVTDVDDVAWTITQTSGPFHGSVASFNAATGSFDYTPDLDFLGADSVFYQADDGQDLSNIALVRLTVLAGCTCPTHADPQFDGVTNVTDVVKAVNVAFRNFSAVQDDGCPWENTDASCDGVTSVVDVVKFVNVAFRNFDPATQFCDPCL